MSADAHLSPSITEEPSIFDIIFSIFTNVLFKEPEQNFFKAQLSSEDMDEFKERTFEGLKDEDPKLLKESFELCSWIIEKDQDLVNLLVIIRIIALYTDDDPYMNSEFLFAIQDICTSMERHYSPMNQLFLLVATHNSDQQLDICSTRLIKALCLVAEEIEEIIATLMQNAIRIFKKRRNNTEMITSKLQINESQSQPSLEQTNDETIIAKVEEFSSKHQIDLFKEELKDLSYDLISQIKENSQQTKDIDTQKLTHGELEEKRDQIQSQMGENQQQQIILQSEIILSSHQQENPDDVITIPDCDQFPQTGKNHSDKINNDLLQQNIQLLNNQLINQELSNSTLLSSIKDDDYDYSPTISQIQQLPNKSLITGNQEFEFPQSIIAQPYQPHTQQLNFKEEKSSKINPQMKSRMKRIEKIEQSKLFAKPPDDLTQFQEKQQQMQGILSLQSNAQPKNYSNLDIVSSETIISSLREELMTNILLKLHRNKTNLSLIDQDKYQLKLRRYYINQLGLINYTELFRRSRLKLFHSRGKLTSKIKIKMNNHCITEIKKILINQPRILRSETIPNLTKISREIYSQLQEIRTKVISLESIKQMKKEISELPRSLTNNSYLFDLQQLIPIFTKLETQEELYQGSLQVLGNLDYAIINELDKPAFKLSIIIDKTQRQLIIFNPNKIDQLINYIISLRNITSIRTEWSNPNCKYNYYLSQYISMNKFKFKQWILDRISFSLPKIFQYDKDKFYNWIERIEKKQDLTFEDEQLIYQLKGKQLMKIENNIVQKELKIQLNQYIHIQPLNQFKILLNNFFFEKIQLIGNQKKIRFKIEEFETGKIDIIRQQKDPDQIFIFVEGFNQWDRELIIKQLNIKIL